MLVGASSGFVKIHVVSLTALIGTKLITINLTEAEQQSRHQLQLSALICQLASCPLHQLVRGCSSDEHLSGPKVAAATACPGPAQLCDGATISVQLHHLTFLHLTSIPPLHSFILQLTLRSLAVDYMMLLVTV